MKTGGREIKTIIKKFYILAILLAILVSLSLMIQYSYLNNINIRDKEINIKKSREILGQEINNELRLHSQIISSASEILSIKKWSEKEIEDYFQKLVKANPTFRTIYYGDTNNKLINSSNWTPPEDYKLSQRGWYTKALEEEKMIYSEAYVDSITNRVIISISKPVYNINNEIQGVVSGDIFIEDIIKLVKNIKSENMGYSFLMDGAGNILAHPKYTYNHDLSLRNIEEIASNILEEMKNKGVGEKQLNLDGKEGYLSYQPIDETDWIIGSFACFDEYNKNKSHIWKMFFIILLIIMTIFGVFLFIQNKQFIKPLYLLEKDIGNIRIKDDINYRVPLDEKDPFLPLRKSINVNLNKTQDYFAKQTQYQEELLASHEELEASYGQLAAMEMELRHQYLELEEREERLYYLSYSDQLTGLYNRRFYEEEIVKVDNENNLPLTFIMADVNGLKLINDSFGHTEGDKLLKAVGQAIQHSSKEGHRACRIGGDEFIMILPKVSSEEVEDIIKEIRRLAHENNPLNIELSISFGTGTKYSKDEDIYQVLKKVEDNMYSNKLAEGPSMRSKIIDAIVTTLYEKNPREEAHSSRVSILCQRMGHHLGMTDEKIKELEKVGLLHDIGKVAISDQILEKSGPLTDEEWEEIKRHPEVGYRILSTTNEMAQMSEYVLAHHERCDGSGYPKGLKCEEIPTISKIISIADAYDAMISDRPYRKGLPEDIAIKEIIKNSGSQFDPELARIFVEKVLGKEWIDKN